MTFKATPGIFILKPLKINNKWGDTHTTQIKLGKVLDRGEELNTDFGAMIEPHLYAKVGDTVAFLSYADGYDKFTTDTGEEVYLVKAQDLRGIVT